MALTKRKAEESPNLNGEGAKVQKLEEEDLDFTTLQQLLEADPDTIGDDEMDFHAHFDKIATLLMNSVAMVVDSVHRFRLVEIEFYLRGGKHDDIFTHCNKDQLTCNEWYFHKQKDGYKGGSYKGLDITFGAKDKSYGGILIRSIQASNEPHSKIIEGPCCVVDNILRLCNADKIIDLVQRPDYNPFIFAQDCVLKIESERQNTIRPIIKSPRVGLTLKKSDQQRIDYILRDYRYLNTPEQMTKGKPYLILTLYKSNQSIQQITDITQTKSSTVRRYIEVFESNTRPIKFFVGQNLNTEFLCGLFAAIKGPRA